MMDEKTICFIQHLNKKLELCRHEFNKLKHCEEAAYVKKGFENILIDIAIMIQLTELFMLLEREFTLEIKRIQEQLIQEKKYIELERTNETISV